MAELAGQAVGALNQLAIDDHAHANVFGHGNGHEVSHAFAMPDRPQFGERAGVRAVFQFDFKPVAFSSGALRSTSLQPSEEKNQALRVFINASGKADADSFIGASRMGAH